MIPLKNKFIVALSTTLFVGAIGCTNLDDKVLDRLSADELSGLGTVTAADALQSVYSQLNALTDQANVYAMQEHSTDEMMGPTRGTDWSDFGTWRRLHQHSWDATHNQVVSAWDILNTGVFRANQAISFAGSDTQIKAEASFLRAFFMSQIVDLYGQVPFREVTDSPDVNPKVFTRAEAFDFVVKDLEFAEANLGAGTAGKATKEAAQFLLAKMYLNKAVYTQDPNTPQGPYTFAKADMDKVIAYCDALNSSGKFQLEPKGEYYDSFHWNNGSISKELIFVIENAEGSPNGSVRNRFHMTLHYNQPIAGGGWNGFTTLTDFYNSFEDGDERKHYEYPGMTDKLGLTAGFLVGQQFDVRKGQKNALKDRGGNPLTFTTDVDLLYSNERRGIRAIKYLPEPKANENAGKDGEPDYRNENNQGNDYVFFRYADAVLMKAEAIHRGGSATMGATVASLVNGLRNARGASTLATIDDAVLLAERGRELYWEGWRRNDMVRFGKFLDKFDQKPTVSANHLVVYPIPQRALDTNPNLKQNTGY